LFATFLSAPKKKRVEMALQDNSLSNASQSGPQLKNPHSPMSIPLDFNGAEKEENVEFEIVSTCGALEPESPWGMSTGAIRGGAIPSFASTASDSDYPRYSDPSSGFEVVRASRGPSETASWNSAATDFDIIAQQNDEYREAVYGSRTVPEPFPRTGPATHMPHVSPPAYWNGAYVGGPMGAQGWYGHNGQPAQSFGQNRTASALQLQAEELDRAAEQLMAAAKAEQLMAEAMRAKAMAFQMMNGAGSMAPPAARPAETQQSRRGLWGLMQKNRPSPAQVEGGRTTIMLRNLPNDYTREMLLDVLDANDFRGHYDFVYLPVDFKRKAGLGYAFVNMATHASADRAFATLHGFTGWQFSSSKVLEVAWGEPLQGLEAHIDRYRNSPVMHVDVPDQFRPLLFQNGVSVPFPLPTKTIQRPKIRSFPEEA